MAKCAVGRNFEVETVEDDGLPNIAISLCDSTATDTIIAKTLGFHHGTAKAIYHVCRTHWEDFKEDNQFKLVEGCKTICSCGEYHNDATMRYIFRRGIR